MSSTSPEPIAVHPLDVAASGQPGIHVTETMRQLLRIASLQDRQEMFQQVLGD